MLKEFILKLNGSST